MNSMRPSFSKSMSWDTRVHRMMKTSRNRGRPLCHSGLDPESRKKMKQYYIYILASKKNGTLYIGVTNNLLKRVDEHKNKLIDGFTKKYNVHNLVYYEQFNDISSAITREKQLKNWKRKYKLELIEKSNPNWIDLFENLTA